MRTAQRFMLTLIALVAPPALRARAGDDLAELYEKASRAIVGIGAWSDPADAEHPSAFGTGTIIAPSGLVLTSITAVPEDAKSIRLYLKGGKTLGARKVLSIPEKELVLLRASAPPRRPLPFLTLGDSSRIRVGQLSIALGNGFHSIEEDDQVTLTAGVISGGYSLLETRDESRYLGPAIETTSAVNDGMDGGPLVNSAGEVVGLLSLNFARERWLGAAIPIDVLKPYLAGELGWFGDRIERLPVCVGLELLPGAMMGTTARGPGGGDAPEELVVSAVDPGGPAARAGIGKGDRILSVEGVAVSSADDFRSRLKETRPGDRLGLQVERGGERRDVEIVLWGRY